MAVGQIVGHRETNPRCVPGVKDKGLRLLRLRRWPIDAEQVAAGFGVVGVDVSAAALDGEIKADQVQGVRRDGHLRL